MKRFILIFTIIIVSVFTASTQSNYYAKKAQRYQKKAEGYRREAVYYFKKTEGYQHEAAYYTKRGDIDRAKTQTRYAEDVMN